MEKIINIVSKQTMERGNGNTVSIQENNQPCNRTCFTDPPGGNLYCGNWIADDSGVYLSMPKKDDIVACPHPVLPVAVLKDIDDGSVKMRIAYKRDGTWIIRDFPKTTIYNDKKIITLADADLSVSSGSAKYLSQYIRDVEELSREKNILPIINTTGKLGWTKDRKYFVPYDIEITYNASQDFPKLLESIQPHGDCETWIQKVSQYRRMNKPEINSMLIASFSSALVEFCGYSSIGLFDLYGPSGKGKSIVMKLCCSVWANPANEGQFIRSFRNTDFSFEKLCYTLGAFPLLLDDSAIIQQILWFQNQCFSIKIM